MTINKKNILIGILALAVIVLLYFLLSQGDQPDSHKYEKEQADNDLKIVGEQRNAGLKKIDSLEKDIMRRDTVETVLRTQLAFTRRDLDKSVKTAVQLARDIKALQDTGSMIGWGNDEWAVVKRATLDSLTAEVGNLAYLYTEYKAYADSVSSLSDSNKVAYLTAINEEKRLYDELYIKYEQLYKLYDNLFKDYSSARKSLKREKIKTKVAALLALIGGVAAAVK